jgi:hypothetical protein
LLGPAEGAVGHHTQPPDGLFPPPGPGHPGRSAAAFAKRDGACAPRQRRLRAWPERIGVPLRPCQLSSCKTPAAAPEGCSRCPRRRREIRHGGASSFALCGHGLTMLVLKNGDTAAEVRAGNITGEAAIIGRRAFWLFRTRPALCSPDESSTGWPGCQQRRSGHL